MSLATGQPGAAARQLLAAARRLMPADARVGRRTLLAALTAATYADKDILGEVLAFASDAAETPVDLQDPSSTADCLLLGFLHRLSGAPQQAAPLLRAAISHLRDPATPDSIRMSPPVVVGAPAAGGELMDEDATYDVINTYVQSARRAGALMALPAALTMQARVHTLRGRFDDAQEACAEGRALGQATGAPGSPDLASFVELALWCWRGHEQEARDLAARITAEAECLEDEARQAYHLPRYYLVVLELGLGRYRQAYDQVLPIFRDDRLGGGTLVLPDLIEAAARCDELPVAREALERLEARAQASGAPWGLGWLARSQALLAADAAEPLYRQAIDHLGQTAILPEIARTHLLYGEWLRRERRRRDARLQLRTAHDMFTLMGADAFTARTRAELAASGERPRQRSSETAQALTPQEAQVARLVAEGGTNRDVAAELFLSPATVEYHLRKVYQKLQVTSRTQLVQKMRSTS